MKTIKFTQVLADLILSGEKTATWRLFDDKNLSLGDKLEFIVKESGMKFAEAEVIDLKETQLGKVDKSDFDGHEKYKDTEEMINTYKKYYGESVSLESPLKII